MTLTSQQRWNRAHPEKLREANRKHQRTEKRRISIKNYKRRHPEKVRMWHRNQVRRRRLCDPIFVLVQRIRTRICDILRYSKNRKSTNTLGLLGCSPRDFKRHIELLFLAGMSWANRSLWHIDHIKPISSFDLSTEAGQRAAFHYTNCQPLWALDNLRKGATV